MGRLAKQLMIGAIYLAIFGLIGYGLYNLVVPDPSCTDGKLNQGEEGVDCGSVCGILCSAPLKPLVVSEPEATIAGSDTDVIVTLRNDNVIYGAARIDYRLALVNAGGEELASRRGSTYANPLETRYLVVTFPGTVGSVLDPEPLFEYDPAQVQWFEGQLPEASVVKFSALNDTIASGAEGLITFTADIRNDSSFDFNEIDVTVMLYDAGGSRVGVGSTVLRTLATGQIREVRIEWPELGRVHEPVRAQVEVTTNVFDNDNFIRTYGGKERFQGF